MSNYIADRIQEASSHQGLIVAGAAALILFGGLSLTKVVLYGALVWGVWSTTQFLPGFLSSPDLRYFMVGLLIVVMLLFKPSGIIPETIERKIK